MNDVQVRDTLTVEAFPVRIQNWKLKKLRGKEIALVKVVWGGVARGNMTMKMERRMRETYPELFSSGKFSMIKIF